MLFMTPTKQKSAPVEPDDLANKEYVDKVAAAAAVGGIADVPGLQSKLDQLAAALAGKMPIAPNDGRQYEGKGSTWVEAAAGSIGGGGGGGGGDDPDNFDGPSSPNGIYVPLVPPESYDIPAGGGTTTWSLPNPDKSRPADAALLRITGNIYSGKIYKNGYILYDYVYADNVFSIQILTSSKRDIFTFENIDFAYGGSSFQADVVRAAPPDI